MRLFKSFFLATTILSAGVATAKADVNVVASIKPVHSLVAAVMEGVGTPSLIVEGAGSPHNLCLEAFTSRKPPECRSCILDWRQAGNLSREAD